MRGVARAARLHRVVNGVPSAARVVIGLSAAIAPALAGARSAVSVRSALVIAIARALSAVSMGPAALVATGLVLSARVLIAGAPIAPAAIAAVLIAVVLIAALPIAPVLIALALSAAVVTSGLVLMGPAAVAAAPSAGRGVLRARAALARALPSRIAALIAAPCGVSAISPPLPAR
jgi:hypothetical protein